MNKLENKIPQTDFDVRRKAVKLVISHLKKKIPEQGTNMMDTLNTWMEEVEELLQREDFVLSHYVEKRKDLTDIIERVSDDEFRYKLRDSWFSLGKAIYKKAKTQP
jgi:hypothetical protein